jgi:Gram-negative bacterial TonB protein C-terminal
MRRAWSVLSAALIACTPYAPGAAPHAAPRHSAAPARPTSCATAQASDSAVHALSDVSEAPVLRGFDVLITAGGPVTGSVRYHVLASVIVNADGRVEPDSVRLLERTETSFDDNAVAFARGLRFWPACRDSKPVRVRVEYPVNYEFCLGGSCTTSPAGH